MNHSYRLVWNDRAQRYVPAPETARARGKSAGGRAPLVLSLAALLAVPAWAGPPALDALPEGGRVSAGQAVISQVGARMEVVQGSERAILEWNRFDIGAHLKSAMRGFLHSGYEGAGKPVVVDKNRAWLHHIEFLLGMEPDACLLVPVRDLAQIYDSIEARHQQTILVDFIDHLADFNVKQRPCP
ncbi:MAG: ESPR domain-containing protein [Pseudomonadota bacterium]|nr:ESPR domain-containing protein [Pseudomonadota bacterium]